MDGTGFNYFENTGYRNERKRMHSVYLKNDTHSHNDNHAFECHLIEPLRLGKVGEVYLDYFMTYDIGAAQANTSGNKSAFVMDIKEFNIQSKSNNMRLHSKIVIPNEDGVGSGTKIHKGRKMNYVATINPGVYHKLSGTITDFLGSSMFSDVDADGHVITFSRAIVTGGFTVHFNHPHNNGLIAMTLIVNFSADETTPAPVAFSGSDGQFGQSRTINVVNTGSISEQMTLAAGLITTVLAQVAANVTSLPDGLLFKKLHGGTIVESTNFVDGSGDITVSIDSPHFVAEFVIIEKD